jgi:hypothetical protein
MLIWITEAAGPAILQGDFMIRRQFISTFGAADGDAGPVIFPFTQAKELRQ